MILSGCIGVHGKFRLWLDESHQALCNMNGSREMTLDCSVLPVEVPALRSLILELMIPRGARTMYGLLGGKYMPNANSSALKISVPQSQEVEAIYTDAMIAAFDTVTIGLPFECAESSIAGIKQAISGGLVPYPGDLHMCFAAYGEASSNEPTFIKLGFLLASLLWRDEESISTEVIKNLFKI